MRCWTAAQRRPQATGDICNLRGTHHHPADLRQNSMNPCSAKRSWHGPTQALKLSTRRIREFLFFFKVLPASVDCEGDPARQLRTTAGYACFSARQGHEAQYMVGGELSARKGTTRLSRIRNLPRHAL